VVLRERAGALRAAAARGRRGAGVSSVLSLSSAGASLSGEPASEPSVSA
jgi:hypothetical protein